MKRQRLLENKVLNFSNIISIILFLIFLSLIFPYIKTKFLKFENFDIEVLFAGIFTFLVEFLIILYLFIYYPFHFQSLFKKKFTGFFKGVLVYFLIIPLLSILVFFSLLLFKKLGLEPVPQEIVFIYFKIISVPVLFFLFFLSSFVAPFFEEIIFRGFLYPAFKEKFSIPFSIFFSALVFSLLHNEIFVLIGIFCLGVILNYIFEKTQNLWICIGLHFGNNFFANLVIFLLKFSKFYNFW